MKKILIAAAALVLYASAGTAFGEVVRQTTGCEAADESCIHLVRNKNGLHLNGTVAGLIPGNAYSIWWITLNADFLPKLILNASGGIANEAGEVHFGAGLRADTYEPGDKPRQVIVPGALDYPLSAFVVLDVLDHGAKLPGLVKEQISTINANCEPAFDCPLASRFFFFPPGP